MEKGSDNHIYIYVHVLNLTETVRGLERYAIPEIFKMINDMLHNVTNEFVCGTSDSYSHCHT